MTAPVKAPSFKLAVPVDELEIIGDYSATWWAFTKRMLDEEDDWGYISIFLDLKTKASANGFSEQFSIGLVGSTENGDRWWFKILGLSTPDLYGMYECTDNPERIRIIRASKWDEWPELV